MFTYICVLLHVILCCILTIMVVMVNLGLWPWLSAVDPQTRFLSDPRPHVIMLLPIFHVIVHFKASYSYSSYTVISHATVWSYNLSIQLWICWIGWVLAKENFCVHDFYFIPPLILDAFHTLFSVVSGPDVIGFAILTRTAFFSLC